MEYTQNYQLPLWDKEDAVIRTDFNENNQKIDAALNELNKKCTFVSGSYIGTGVGGRSIEMGFRPKLVILCGYYGINRNIAILSDIGALYNYETKAEISTHASIMDTGIYLSGDMFHNYTDKEEYYFAFA